MAPACNHRCCAFHNDCRSLYRQPWDSPRSRACPQSEFLPSTARLMAFECRSRMLEGRQQNEPQIPEARALQVVS